MTDRTAAEVMCCPNRCEMGERGNSRCGASVFAEAVSNLHAAGCMIVAREPTAVMRAAAIDRNWNFSEIYRAMTTEGELK